MVHFTECAVLGYSVTVVFDKIESDCVARDEQHGKTWVHSLLNPLS